MDAHFLENYNLKMKPIGIVAFPHCNAEMQYQWVSIATNALVAIAGFRARIRIGVHQQLVLYC